MDKGRWIEITIPNAAIPTLKARASLGAGVAELPIAALYDPSGLITSPFEMVTVRLSLDHLPTRQPND